MERKPTIVDLFERLEHEREAADRQYNEALTALDRAYQDRPDRPGHPAHQARPGGTDLPAAPIFHDASQVERLNEDWKIVSEGAPAAGRSLKGRLGGFIRRALAPVFYAQQRFNASVVDHINRNVVAQEQATRAAAALVDAARRELDAVARLLLFGLTIIPGALAVALIFLVPEADPARLTTSAKATAIKKPDAPTAPTAVVSAPLPPSFKRFMLVLALFTLGNSSDAFLLLRLTDAAGTVRFVPLMWAALHVVKASVSMAAGSWSDRIGRRTVITTGWLVYAVVYVGFALSTSIVALFSWFLLYGFYFGFAEGTEKALVADLAPAERRGFTFGIYNAVTGVGALAASVLFGLVWTAYGATAAFGLGAALALVAAVLLFVVVPART